jgi:hypothetical protein
MRLPPTHVRSPPSVAQLDVAMLDAVGLDKPAERGTLAGDLLAPIDAPSAADQTAALDALARPPLVGPGMAVPEVRAKVAALRHTRAGHIVRNEVYPVLYRWALRLA